MRKKEAEEPDPKKWHHEKDNLPSMALAMEGGQEPRNHPAAGMWEKKEKQFFLKAFGRVRPI